MESWPTIGRWTKKTKNIVRLTPFGIDSTFFLVFLWNSSFTRPSIQMRFLWESHFFGNKLSSKVSAKKMNQQFLIWEIFELESQSPLILEPDLYNGIAKLSLCLHVVLMNQIMFIDRKLTFDYYIIGMLSTNKYCLEWEFRVRTTKCLFSHPKFEHGKLHRPTLMPSNAIHYTYINIHSTYDFRFFNYVQSV